ncbi:hypothetical protein [Deinococcus sp. QL22]|uniref:hypothetical protein n=1 Tax=Deinococcus sp. QL22 TaxID=2939437 RepID=UPI002017B1EC|nr:hypothetical protein [Deinococcus sp. QL22]UQN06270.1 hypothetical protein M1R55_15640 [Deinococcus sp. QL22]
MSLETRLSALGTRIGQVIKAHLTDTANPHAVTKAQVGLGNVLNSPQIPASEKGTASGVATLGADGKVPSAQLPAGGSSPARTTASVTSSVLANNASEDLSITLAKGYALHKVTLSVSGWLRVYRDTASRTADASRAQTTDPAPGSGVVAEVIGTLGVWDQAVSGWDGKTPPDGVIPLRLSNLSGAAQTITITLTYLPLEA